MRDEELLKNMLYKIAKPIFDKFAYVRNFKFVIDNRHQDSVMWYIDYIQEVNGQNSNDLYTKRGSYIVDNLKNARESVPVWTNGVKNILEKMDKLIIQLENIQKKTEESDSKIRAVLDIDLLEWKNRHADSEEIMNVYYKVFPIDKIERVYVTADRKKGIMLSAINFKSK